MLPEFAAEPAVYAYAYQRQLNVIAPKRCSFNKDRLDELFKIHIRVEGDAVAYEIHGFIDDCDTVREIYSKIYFRGKKCHREGGPAIIDYEDGALVREVYYQHGELHRIDGPAYITYKNSAPEREEYWQSGELYRPDGPAVRAPSPAVVQHEV